MTPLPECPDEPTLRSFASKRLDAQAAAAVRAHVARCERCRNLLDDLGDDGDWEWERGTAPGDAPTETEFRSRETSLDSELLFLGASADPKAMGRIGNYEVLGVLGRGGMGVVLDAFDPQLHRRVAVKVLSAQLATSRKAHRRFSREARAAAAINHPNVVTIHAVDEQAGMPFLVMEFVSGRTLRERIHAGSLDLTTILRIGAQVAAGLVAAHEHGVIHRDIKPANILLEDGIERVKLTDFGLALVALDASQISSGDRPVGTPAYMSPEQVGGGKVDARSDLFSLGCVLYAMVTGKSPFHGNNPLDIARKVADLHPPTLAEVAPTAPRFLSIIVKRLLAKDPNDRFQTAIEVRDTLLKHLAAAHELGSTLESQFPSPRVTRRRPRRWVGVALAMAVLGTVAIAAGVAYWPRPEFPPAANGRATGVVTVSQTEPADCTTLAEAYALAGPGDRIRILDSATYRESLRIGPLDPKRGLTIESPHGATLENPDSAGSLVVIEHAPGLILRGLHLKTHSSQHGISIIGACPGLTIDGLKFTQPPDAIKSAIVLWQGTHGTAEQPIVLRRLDVSCGDIGIVVVGAPKRPSSHIVIEHSRFAGPGVHIALQTALRDVRVERCTFVKGMAGLGFEADQPQQLQRLSITHNTFFQTTAWVAVENTSFDQVEMKIAHNLILESNDIKLDNRDFAAVAAQWFSHNWWERSAGINEERAKLVGEVKDEIPLLSRDPAHPDFLRPAVGALPKPDFPASDDRPFVGAVSPHAPTPSEPKRKP